MQKSPFEHFHPQRFCYLGSEKLVYSLGEGPLVVLLHEAPGPIPEAFALGLRLSQQGFKVYMPMFFGKPNAPFSMRTTLKELTLGCIRREFAVFASNKSSPAVEWLRAFCKDLLREHGQNKIGMIGMCFTGNFALGLIAEAWMKAPVLSQPSLPYNLGKKRKAGLHVSPETIEKAKERSDLEILGLRFTGDILCPKAKFTRLRETFGDRFQGIEIDSSLFNPHRIPVTAHSVLTLDFVDETGHPTHQAWLSMVNFLNKQLQ